MVYLSAEKPQAIRLPTTSSLRTTPSTLRGSYSKFLVNRGWMG
jgi:hypothetical protein